MDAERLAQIRMTAIEVNGAEVAEPTGDVAVAVSLEDRPERETIPVARLEADAVEEVVWAVVKVVEPGGNRLCELPRRSEAERASVEVGQAKAQGLRDEERPQGPEGLSVGEGAVHPGQHPGRRSASRQPGSWYRPRGEGWVALGVVGVLDDAAKVLDKVWVGPEHGEDLEQTGEKRRSSVDRPELSPGIVEAPMEPAVAAGVVPRSPRPRFGEVSDPEHLPRVDDSSEPTGWCGDDHVR